MNFWVDGIESTRNYYSVMKDMYELDYSTTYKVVSDVIGLMWSHLVDLGKINMDFP